MTQPLRSDRRAVLAGGAALASPAILPRQGRRSAGLAREILRSGVLLDTPRRFAALPPITTVGLVLFGLMAGLQRLLLGHRHDSAAKVES